MRTITLVFLWLLLFAASCDDSSTKLNRNIPTQEQLIEANKKKIGKESKLIDDFIKQSGWEMSTTSTGIRYDVFHKAEGVNAKSGSIVSIDYSLYLLDGSKISDTKVSGPVTFKVGEGDVVSGLHEAVTLLAEGDSARVILPSYLAYGLTGDQNRIPPNAALFYSLSLVKLD
ncbi:MAG: FKBP-type peptidyl-prolyl cis-trans isomerase [Bacteroidota bacterium]